MTTCLATIIIIKTLSCYESHNIMAVKSILAYMLLTSDEVRCYQFGIGECTGLVYH